MEFFSGSQYGKGMEKLCASGSDACGFDDGKIHPSGAFCRACMHDIPVIQAYLVWMAAIYLLLHLIADLLMGALDPRAKLEGMR